MERQPQGEVRTPNSHWSGIGLSKSSPFSLENASRNNNQWDRGENLPYNLGVTTGVLDVTPTSQRTPFAHFKDIHTLLTHLGLDHYISKYVILEVMKYKIVRGNFKNTIAIVKLGR